MFADRFKAEHSKKTLIDFFIYMFHIHYLLSVFYFILLHVFYKYIYYLYMIKRIVLTQKHNHKDKNIKEIV